MFASVGRCLLSHVVGTVAMERGWQKIFRDVVILLYCDVSLRLCVPSPSVYLWWKNLSWMNDLLRVKQDFSLSSSGFPFCNTPTGI